MTHNEQAQKDAAQEDAAQANKSQTNKAQAGAAPSPAQSPAPSPCVKICTLDPTGAFCVGCGRTPAEIFAAGAHLERRAAR
jgi:hypothetical protein